MIGLSVVLAIVITQAIRWLKTSPAVAPSPPLRDAQVSSVTFLVPAWSAEADITPFVASFNSLHLPEKQLVLCAGGTDKTLELALKHASQEITVLTQRAGEGKQRALAEGFKVARGDLIFLTDIDCRLSNACVLPLLQHVQLHPDEVATGSVRPLPQQLENNFVAVQWAVRERSNPPDGAVAEGLDGRNTAMSRRLLEISRGFDTPAPSGTDYTLAKELALRGVVIRYVGSSQIETEFPENLATYIKKQARWLRNVFVLGQKYGARNEVNSVAKTLAFPISILILSMAGFFNAYLWWISLYLVVYSATNRMLYLRLIERPRALISVFSLLLGDWAAALLTLRQIYRRDYRWS